MRVCSELAVGGSVFLNRAPDREAADTERAGKQML